MTHRRRLAALANLTSILGHYGVALGSVALALLLSLLFRSLIDPNPFLLFFAAVALSAWMGGLRAGLVATGLAALVTDYILIPPAYALSLAPTDLARVIGFVLIALLISGLSEAHRRAAAALRVSEVRSRATLEAALDGIITIDQTGRVVAFNPAAEQIFAYRQADVLGHELADLIVPPSLRDEHRRGLAQSVATGEGRLFDRRIEMTAMRADGSEFPVELIITRIATNGQVCFTGFIRDLTKGKLLEAQFLQAQKVESIGRLAGGIAHDFNNLLTAMAGYTELARDALPADHPAQSDLEEVQKAAQRAGSLTRQLLAFARKQPIEPHVINLNALLRDMDKLLRRLIGEDIDLVTQPMPDLGHVIADPGQIEQVIVNLAVNARDAMPEGGKLTIETRNVRLDSAYAQNHLSVIEGAYVLLAVSDSGVGMDAEVQRHLFEPFFTTKAQGKGTGLGLATCYGIIKQHGGFIWVYSEVGYGTTIKIYLPRVYQAAEVRPPVDEQVVPWGTETVLLVEDELAVRVFAARVLREAGYTVLEASNGTEALHFVQEYPRTIQLLLTDVVLPQMGGKALATRLTAQSPTLKVLFMSGYAEDAIVHHGRLETGLAFLHKPFSLAALLRKVRETLDTP
jgi:PAS domain S-box-containing protein